MLGVATYPKQLPDKPLIFKGLHLPAKNKKTSTELANDYSYFFTQSIPDIANLFSIIGNGLSSLAHLVGAGKKTKAFTDLLASFGTKSFLSINSCVNTFENFARRNYLAALGYFLDNPIAFLVPEEFVFLARGISSGTYHLAHFLSVINGNRACFKDLKDHSNHLYESFEKFFKNICNKNILTKFFDSSKATPGIIGGLMSIVAPLTYPFLGLQNSSLIRDIGAVLKSSCHLSFGHLKHGRKYFFASGVLQAAAALSDFTSYLKPSLRNIMVPISLGLDGFAKYILRKSVNNNELGKSYTNLEDCLASLKPSHDPITLPPLPNPVHESGCSELS